MNFISGMPLNFYGLLVAAALYSAVQVVQNLAAKEGFSKEFVWDAVVWMAIPALIGARLYHVVDLWSYYSNNLGEVVAVWRGGIGIFGAIVGGVVGMLLFAKRRHVSDNQLLKMFDLAALGLPLGQAIGRWGNYFNQELYGAPTDLPWKIFIDPAHRLAGYESVAYYHPLFLYESLLNLCLFGIGYSLYRYIDKSKRMGSGLYVGLYLIGYGSIRFGLEFIRLEKWTASGVSVAQIVSLGMIGVGGVLVYRALKIVSR